MRAAPFLLVAFLLLSGCAGSKPPASTPPPLTRDPAQILPLLSPIQFKETLKEHPAVPSFDGKKMDSWVYRPKTPDGVRVPVIINFSPYWGNLAPAAGERGDHFSQYLIDYFVPRGFAVVLTSVRGTGQSEGCFNLGGETEKRDALAVIDHFAKQPWSNGNVAAGGKSYDGTTPQGAATLAPRALKAIIPVSPISELYKYNYKSGLSYNLQGASFNARYVALVGWGEDPTSPGVPFGGSLMPDDACADFPVIAGEGLASAATGDYTPYWQERDYAAKATAATPALFYIHGLQDWNVKPDNILPWLERYAGPKKAWLHQWSDPSNGGHVYPFREDWNYTMLRFLDHTLKGLDTGLFDEPSIQVEDTLGRWRHEDAWPPATAVPQQLYLSSQGNQGQLGNPGDGTARSFLDNGESAGDAQTDNQLRYESAPLAADWHLAGVPKLHLPITSDRPTGKVGVSLYDVDATGKAKLIDWGGLNLRHRDDVRTPKDVAAGTQYDVVVEMFPQDTVIRADHRLVLVLAGNAGSDEFDPVPTNARMTIAENAKTILELPIEPEPAMRFESPPPVETRCWAC